MNDVAISPEWTDTVLDHTLVKVAYLDADFNFIKVNRAYAAADEREPSYFPGKNHFDLYPNEEIEKIFHKTAGTGEPYFIKARPFAFADHPDRGVSYWDWSLVPIMDENGKTSGLVLTIQNVTDQSKARQALDQQTHFTQIFLDSIPAVALLLHEGSREIVASNKHGRAVNAVPGATCYETWARRETPCPWCQAPKVWSTNQSQHLEFQVGGIYWDAYWIHLENDLYLHYAFDVTERKLTEKERERLVTQLEEKNRDLAQLVRITSHDLRSPAINVKGFTGVLERALSKLRSLIAESKASGKDKMAISNLIEQDLADPLRYLRSSAEKMEALLAGLLRLSRLGLQSLNLDQLDMNVLFEDIAESFQFQLTESGAQLVIGEQPPCQGDEDQVNQVFSNLLDNALKYLA
ncbi:MAG: PAS domain-containing protein, partial [Candidatus Neomarinimicrobiota bacterium]